MGWYGLYLICVDSDQIMSISVAMLASNPQKIQYIFNYDKYVKNYGAKKQLKSIETINNVSTNLRCEKKFGLGLTLWVTQNIWDHNLA